MLTNREWRDATQGLWANDGYHAEKYRVTAALAAFWNNLGNTDLPTDRANAAAVRTAVNTAMAYGGANGFSDGGVAMRVALTRLSASAAQIIADHRALVVQVAKRLLDPFVTTRTIGQDAGAHAQIRGMAHHMAALFNNAATGHGNHQLLYWDRKGRQEVARANGSTLRCDGSSGIIVHLLLRKIGGMRMEVVSQGSPTFGGGHWYVVLNRPVGANLNFAGQFPSQCITLDIWGAINADEDSAVFHDPPEAIFDCVDGTPITATNHNNIVVRAPVATPQQTGAQRALAQAVLN